MHAHTARSIAAACPNSGTASPRLRQAIAKHRHADRELSAAAAASGLSIYAPELDKLDRAEHAAFDAVLAVPVNSRADMVAMFRHIAPGVDDAEPTDSLSMAVHMLRRLLGEDATRPPAAALS